MKNFSGKCTASNKTNVVLVNNVDASQRDECGEKFKYESFRTCGIKKKHLKGHFRFA